jgi:nitrite reductase/ring-hydroxylating ferredoxin subunit
MLARRLLAAWVMATTIYRAPRTAVPADGVMTFEVDGVRCLVVDADGELRAFSVVGQSAPSVGRAAVVDGRVLCPLHGWPIDPDDGRCRASELCRYEPLTVEADADEIRVHVPRS